MKKINLQFRNIKKYPAVLFFLLVATISYAQTHTGNLTLTNQTAIDDFNFTEVTGNLTIFGGSITNLDSLSGLTEIGGVLNISLNFSLTSLSGLEMLDSIGGALTIIGNSGLTDLRGLSSLTEIGGHLDIRSNVSLTSLSGLESLTEIGGNLNILSNTSLTSLSGLSSLTEIGGSLQIQSNVSLPSLSGLDSLTEIGGLLFIGSNNSLTSLSGLEMLDSIGGALTITGNRDLTDFCVISSLIGGDKQITSGEYSVTTNGYNPSYGLISNETFCGIFAGDLTLDTQDSIDVFHYRGITGNLTINDSLDGNITNLDGLEMLDSIGGTLTITGNPNLSNFCAISTLIGDANQITMGEYTVSGNRINPTYGRLQEVTYCDGSIFFGDLTLDTQASIDAYSHRRITGNMTINDALEGNITNLDGLSGLTEIGGYLDISDNSSLTSLSGLEMLDSIGGTLTITGNLALSNFCAISSLIGDDKQITMGEYTVSGNRINPTYGLLQEVTYCDGSIFFGDLTLDTQASIDAFSHREITGNLTIDDAANGNITNLDSLSGLTEIGGNIDIQLNDSLTSLSGLESLTEIGGYLFIESNNSLPSLSGLDSLTDIDKNLTIQNNNTLTSLSGLESLTEIGGDLGISINNSLTSLSGLESLTEIGGDLDFNGNTSLPSLSGLESLTEIGGYLFIQSNNSLTSLSGLGSLTEIGGYLDISDNSSLMSLSGLEMLDSIGGALTITGNSSLMSLSGLEMLTSIGGSLTLTGNTDLTDFCAVSSLIGDANQITAGEYTVTTNGYNPPYRLIDDENYCSNLDGGIFVGDLTLDTQDSIDAFRYREIIGNLTIDDAANGNITNLDGLRGLTDIGGNLSIQSNDSLSSLSGLEMLDSIGGVLTITGNTALTDFCAISSLIGEDKQITMREYSVTTNGYNPPYTLIDDENYCSNLDGGIFVGDLTLTSQASIDTFRYRRITGNLTINDTDDGNITNLDSLSGLTEIQGDLSIRNNDTLTSLSGLESLIEIGGYLSINNNATLMSLSGLESLTEIGGQLAIQNNVVLASLSGLEMLTSIGGSLTLTGNTDLTDFCAVSSLIGDANQITAGEYTVTTNGYNPPYTLIDDENYCSNADGRIFDGSLMLTSQASIDTFRYRRITGNLTIDDAANGNITNLDSLRGLSEVRGFLTIQNNDTLTSLSGLESLIEIGGTVTIFSNDTLTSLSGLDALTEIGGNLDVTTNTSLTSLSGLDALTTVNGILQITTNTSLTSLSGLEMLESIGGRLTLTSNPALTDFCVLSSLIGDDNQITSGEYTVTTNGYNPPYTFIQNESLCSNADGEIFDGNLTLNNQDSIDDFRYRAITGNLIIDESVANAITNLDGLNELTNIGGNLTIQSNDSLVSLSGLEMLGFIGGTLTITGNTALADFCSLSSLIGDDNQITMGEYTVTTNGYNPPYTIVGNENFCSNADGRIFVGDLMLTSQAAIDTFNYRGVTGDLTINDSINANITNLDSLRGLTGIGGFLRISENSSLTSLSGLESLTEIGGNLNFNENTSLPSLRGLDSLTEIGGNFSVFSTSLTSLSGLESLTDIGGDLSIQFNFFLPSLSGLESLIAIGGDVGMSSNASLMSLSGLDALTEIGGSLSITNNDSIASLSGLEMLDSIGGLLSIINNPALTDFCVLSSLIGDDKQITSAEYTLNINSYNPSYALISNETFCSNADGGIFVGDLMLTSQAAIDTFNYRGIIGDLTINDSINANITNLDGLIGLTEVRGFLSILSNDSLISLSGLEDLIEIEGTLFIGLNASLPSLSGLEALNQIGGFLSIQSNDSLMSLSGLEMLDSIGGDLMITGNTALTNFCVISSLIGDDNQITSGEYTVTTNGYNPSFEEIQRSYRCSTNPPVVVATLQNVTTRSTVPFATINVAPAFSDPNRDPLTYTATSSDESIITVAVTDSTLTLTEVSTGMVTITVTATDDVNLSVSDVFMAIITPNNPPVVENPLAAIERVSGTAFAPIDISATFSDPDGDALTYTVASSNTAIVTATLNGTTLTLTETGKGTATITVTATDALGSVEATFEVTITNTAPTVATALTDVVIQPGAGFAPIDLSATFSDENGDALSYTAMSDNETVVTVSVSGTTLTLTEVGTGRATITVTASDGTAPVSSVFMVTITNNTAPIRTALTFPAIPPVSVGFQLEPAVNLTPFFSDPDGDALTFTASTTDASVATVSIVEPSSVTLTAIGVGTTTITVTATDPGGLSVSETVMITVVEALGIADTDILALYPNPSSGLFQLSRTADVVSVYDMNGRLVYRGRKIKQLDLTSQPSGQYLVEVGVGKEKGRYTVIRE